MSEIASPDRVFPHELDRFNWGAAFVPLLWYAFHGAPAISVGFVLGYVLIGPFFSSLEMLPAAVGALIEAVLIFGVSALVARRANRIAWRNSPYELSVERYLAVQRQWAIGGAVAFAALLGWMTIGNL